MIELFRIQPCPEWAPNGPRMPLRHPTLLHPPQHFPLLANGSLAWRTGDIHDWILGDLIGM